MTDHKPCIIIVILKSIVQPRQQVISGNKMDTVRIFTVLILVSGALGFKDGDMCKIISAADGNALSVNSSGYTLTTDPWVDGVNQKWLAVEAIVATDAYLMVPQRQGWDWAKFTASGTTGKRDQLPDNTMVAAYDSGKKEVIQESYTKSSPSKAQQWQSTSMGHDKFLIKNLADGKCLVNLGPLKKHQSLVEKAKHKLQKLGGKKHKKPKPGSLALLDCIPTDDKHLWRLEVLPASVKA